MKPRINVVEKVLPKYPSAYLGKSPSGHPFLALI